MDNNFHMPHARFNQTYPEGPYRFNNREFIIISYRTHLDRLKEMIPAPLEPVSDIVNFEFIRMPDSTGFGDYTECGQVVPVKWQGKEGSFSLSMFLDCYAPIAGGREIWGFPKKLAKPAIEVDGDAIICTLDYGKIRIATATMGYKYKAVPTDPILQSLVNKPNFLLKNIPDVNGNAKICQLVKYHLQDVNVKGAWSGPASLELHPHALARINYFEVLEVVSALHIVTDLTLPYGEVAVDYLAEKK